MSRQYGETGPYERPHDDWSGPMARIGPSAAAPRYAAGNYNDWSGPLERIDPAAPPSRYGAPAHYGSPASSACPGSTTPAADGGTGQYERPHAEPRYERTGEIDRCSAQYAPAPVRVPGRPALVRRRRAAVRAPGYGPPAYGREAQSGPPMPRQPRSGAYERPHPAQYQSASTSPRGTSRRKYQYGQYASGPVPAGPAPCQ